MLKVYIDSIDEELSQAEKLKETLIKNSSVPLDVRFLHLESEKVKYRRPIHGHNIPRNEKVFYKFLIPSLTKERVIYIDSSIEFNTDISKLLDFETSDYEIVVFNEEKPSPVPKLLIMNCSKIKWNIHSIIEDLNNGKYRYDDLVFKLIVANILYIDYITV